MKKTVVGGFWIRYAHRRLLPVAVDPDRWILASYFDFGQAKTSSLYIMKAMISASTAAKTRMSRMRWLRLRFDRRMVFTWFSCCSRADFRVEKFGSTKNIRIKAFATCRLWQRKTSDRYAPSQETARCLPMSGSRITRRTYRQRTSRIFLFSTTPPAVSR